MEKKEIDDLALKEIDIITKRYIREIQQSMQRFANDILQIGYKTGK